MMIEKTWYKCSPTLLSFILRPLSWLFRFFSATRILLYRLGFMSSVSIPVPIVVVGNITVGGTGKTPLVIWLANMLTQQGYQPGIVSRGFRGHATKFPQPVTIDSDPEQVGDEPVLLAHRTHCPVVVDPNRVSAAQYLLQHYPCDLIISDDGLQHYALRRDIEILVVDSLRQFGNRLCFPAGPLREPLSRLHKVDFVVCNGGDNKQGWFTMQLVADEIYNVLDVSQSLSLLAAREHEWEAVAGIGNPERFFLQLESAGFTIRRHPFPDHYKFSQKDIVFGVDNFVIMTEKDAMKCRYFADHRHWCLPVSAQLPPTFSQHLLSSIDTLRQSKKSMQ